MFSSSAIPFWTAVAALAAAGSAVIAALYTFLTFRLVQLQDQAKVIVFVRHDLERASILCIRITNIGRDIARDVRFTPSRPIPEHAVGMEIATAVEAKPMTEGPLIDGIPALGPGDVREITWGQYGGLMKNLGNEPILLDFTYSSGKRRLRGSAVLEAKSYVATNASEAPLATAVRHLEKIAKATEGTQQAILAVTRKLNERNEQS